MAFKHNELSKSFIENIVGLPFESLTNLDSEVVLFFLKNKKNVEIIKKSELSYEVSIKNRCLTLDYLYTMHKFDTLGILYGKIKISYDELEDYVLRKKKYTPDINDILTCC